MIWRKFRLNPPFSPQNWLAEAQYWLDKPAVVFVPALGNIMFARLSTLKNSDDTISRFRSPNLKPFWTRRSTSTVPWLRNWFLLNSTPGAANGRSLLMPSPLRSPEAKALTGTPERRRIELETSKP